jgi:CBS domain-containing protein
VVTVTADADIEEAAALMLNRNIARLPVVDSGQVIGIVTRADIVQGVGSGFSGNEGDDQ